MLIIRVEEENKFTMLYHKAVRILGHMISSNSNDSSKILPLSPTNVRTKLQRLSSFGTSDDNTTVDNTDTFSWNSGNPFYDDQSSDILVY